MDNIVKVNPNPNTVNSLVQDLVDAKDNIESILIVYVDKEGDVWRDHVLQKEYDGAALVSYLTSYVYGSIHERRFQEEL